MKKKNSKDGSGSKNQKPVNTEQIRKGLIVAHRGVAVDVVFDDGECEMVRVKRRSGHVVGDGVAVRGEVLKRLPRRTELRRRDARGAVHLVGANLDVLGIVVAPRPAPPSGFIDRAIVAARVANLQPFVVLNKSDLDASAELFASLLATYSSAVSVFSLSASKGQGLDPLLDFLAEGHRGAFVGTSGVGKSSLLNVLCPGIDLGVGEISEYGQGRHTTTVATLNTLSGGGELIDTPGFRDFGLVDISVQDLSEHFPGFEKARDSTCRFRDCRHRSEPGCAVVELVTQNQVSAERYENYLEILQEVEAAEEETRRRGWKN